MRAYAWSIAGMAVVCAILCAASNAQEQVSRDLPTPKGTLRYHHGPARFVARGNTPWIVLDDVHQRYHIAYYRDDTVYYRTADLDGNLTDEEAVLRNATEQNQKLWQPIIVLDKNQAPHLMVVQNRFGDSRESFYTNRIGGGWKPAFDAFAAAGFAHHRGTFMHRMLVDDDLNVYLSAKLGNRAASLLKLTGVDTDRPEVSPHTFVETRIESMGLFLRNGELWGAGHGGHNRDRDYFLFQRYDRDTLQPIGDAVLAPDAGAWAENAWALMDASGNIHIVASSSYGIGGTYTNLAMAGANQPVLRFRNKLRHHYGAGAMAVDRRNGLLYVYYPSVETTDSRTYNEHRACYDDLRYRVAIIDTRGPMLLADMIDATGVPGSHCGEAFRLVPALAPHPQHGAMAMVKTCEDGAFREGSLYLVRLGAELLEQ